MPRWLPNTLYIAEAEPLLHPVYKVGITSVNIEDRLAHLRSTSPSPIAIVEAREFDDASFANQILRAALDDYHLHNGWFLLPRETLKHAGEALELLQTWDGGALAQKIKARGIRHLTWLLDENVLPGLGLARPRDYV